MTNTAAELGPSDKKAQEIIHGFFRALEDIFFEILRRGTSSRVPDHTLKPKARFIVMTLQGLQVLWKSGMEKPELEQLVDFVVDAIGDGVVEEKLK